jgi:hypothetical protein
MKNDIEILSAVCGELPRLKPARIVATDTGYTDAADVLSAFLAFGGEGWLCTTDSKAIYRLPSDTPSGEEYPLHGELAKGGTSLHLRQDGAGGWTLTRLEETADEHTLCFESTLLAYDPGVGYLRYQVCHEPVAPGIPEATQDIQELRPARSRFLGFSHESQR